MSKIWSTDPLYTIKDIDILDFYAFKDFGTHTNSNQYITSIEPIQGLQIDVIDVMLNINTCSLEMIFI